MGKRSDFERKPRDFYPTPYEAAKPLIEHLPKHFTFAEPCAGNGALINHLETRGGHGLCMWASDIEPQHKGILTQDYRDVKENELFGIIATKDLFIISQSSKLLVESECIISCPESLKA